MRSHKPAAAVKVRGLNILERLIADGKVPVERAEDVVVQAQRGDVSACEAMLELELIGEDQLLRFMAAFYQTRFVGTDKLSRASVDPALIKVFPKKLALRLLVCPILYDPKERSISVVAADPTIADIAKQVQLVTQIMRVHVYVAREAAVLAAIRKHYDGARNAFELLMQPDLEISRTDGRPAEQNWEQMNVQVFTDMGESLVPQPRTDASQLNSSAASIEQAKAALKETIASIYPGAPHAAHEQGAAVPQKISLLPDKSAPDFSELVNLLVALLEQDRPTHRGHSARVARLCTDIARKMRIDAAEIRAIQLAAHLHDVGKTPDIHETPFAVARDKSLRGAAKKKFAVPARFFESANLASATVQALNHVYERVDGTGFPHGLTGSDIPLGARILAVVESYDDLTHSDRHPLLRRLAPEDACKAIQQDQGAVFDAGVVDWLRHLVLDNALTSKLLVGGHRVMLVDASAEETAVLEVRLMEKGFDVDIARCIADARTKIAESRFDIVISEVELPDGSGFELAKAIKTSPNVTTPIVFLTSKHDPASVSKGFDSGAADYLLKPASGDIVAAKIHRIIEGVQSAGRGAATQGVSGSLREMALPELIQIIAAGRKSGVLSIRTGGKSGVLEFSGGMIHDARYLELQGEQAVYQILRVVEGEFSFDATAVVGENHINRSTDFLLLEAFRLLDEEQQMA